MRLKDAGSSRLLEMGKRGKKREGKGGRRKVREGVLEAKAKIGSRQ
jgi:hypothetical protein